MTLASGGGMSTGGVDTTAGTGSGLSGAPTVQADDPTCTNFTAPRLAVLTPIDPQATQLAGTGLSSTQKLTMLSGPPCPTYNCFSSNAVTGTTPALPAYEMRDGPRGVRAINSANTQSWPSTTWAVAEARAASFDIDLEYRVGVAQGVEAYGLLADVILAPVVNTLRNPLWARAQETYGEDPVVLGEMGAAFTRGLQQNVAACPKHFVMNDTDNNRTTANAIVDEQTLRENYTRPFEIVVKKADPACIMAAYNQVNGLHSTENQHILTDILRTDWGWQGYVVSDWWATIPGHGAATLNAGLDLEMPDQAAFQGLPSALTSGGIQTARVTEAATRILNARIKFKGLTAAYQSRTRDTNVASDANRAALARETEEKGAVLLKNGATDTTRILPLGPKATAVGFGTPTVTTIAVVGPDSLRPIAPTQSDNATGTFVSGLGDSGSSQTIPPHSVSFVQGIKNYVMKKGLSIAVTQSLDASAAAGASVVIVPVTMSHEDEGEGYNKGADRKDFTLSGAHPMHWTQKPAGFINDLAKTNPNVVVLLAVGSAIVMEDWMASARGIVQTFYPGQEGGDAVASLLFGDINFSGKLPFTVAQNPADYPPFQNAGASAQIEYLHGYRRFEANNAAPRFWFGYGQSYTTYEYSNLKVLCSTVSATGRLNVQVTVKNTGMMAGDEVVQLYIGYPNTKAAKRPKKELKAFTRVTLAPGASQDVQLNVPVPDMAYWGASGWVVEKVAHTVLVGPSADPTKLLSADFTIQ
jgi:beta-glucosidase